MAQIIVGDKSPIQDFPFEDEVHDMGDFIVAHPDILGSEVAILARELQVPRRKASVAGPGIGSGPHRWKNRKKL